MHFVKYTQYQDMFKMKDVNFNKILWYVSYQGAGVGQSV